MRFAGFLCLNPFLEMPMFRESYNPLYQSEEQPDIELFFRGCSFYITFVGVEGGKKRIIEGGEMREIGQSSITIYNKNHLITELPTRIYKEISTIKAGGIEIQGLRTMQISRRKLVQDAVIEEYTFVAHCDCAKISLNETIRISAQLVSENHQINNVKAIELVEDVDDVELKNLSSSLLFEAFDDIPMIQTNIILLTSPNRFSSADLSQNISIGEYEKLSKNDKALIIAGFNLLTKQPTSLERLLPFLTEGGYLLTREKCCIIDYKKYLQRYDLNVILEKCTDKEMIVLLKKKVSIGKRTVIYINNDNFNWLENLKLLMSENNFDKNSRIIIVGEGDFECGLLGFVNCLRKESGGEYVRSVLVQDEGAPKFSLQDSFYTQQLEKDMTINVLRSNKTWGSYRYLKLQQPRAELVPTAHVHQTVQIFSKHIT